MSTQKIYTSDWFSSNIKSWEHIFNYVGWDAHVKKNVIEIGSYEGRSSVWILDNLLKSTDSVLHCVDVFPDSDSEDSYYARFKNNVLEHDCPASVYGNKSFSFDFLSRYAAEGKRADFIYVDGSHRASDVLEDLVLSLRILNSGGVIICDDYLGGSVQNITLGTPKIAVDAVTNIYRDQIELIPGQALYQLAFTKTRDRNLDDPGSRGMTEQL